MTPVTIGDQKFVKDANRGWIDSKTKLPADKGLIRLLDSLVIDEPVLKKLRTKIDTRVEPITIGGQKFVYDVNRGWIDDKTKVPAPKSLQLTLSNLVPRFGKNDAGDIDLTAGFGIVGQAAQQQTQTKAKPKSGGGTLVYNNANIKEPIIKMINALALIDGSLKQRLNNQKIIAAADITAIRESQIEAIDQEQPIKVIKPDAEKVDGSSAGLLALGGLALLTLDPVQEALKSVVDGVVNAGKFLTSAVTSINNAFAFILSSNATDPTATDSSSESKPTAPATAPDAQPVTEEPSAATGNTGDATAAPSVPTPAPAAVPSTTNTSKPSSSQRSSPTPSTTGGATTPISTGSSTPRPTAIPVATGSTPPSVPSSSPPKPTTQSAENTGNIIQVNHSDTGSGWGIAGATDARGRPVAFSKEGATAFAKMMQDSNGIVKPSDVASSKRSAAKNAAVNGATNSPHLRGVAMDIHGASGAWIRQNGHKYGWKAHDYHGTHGGHFIFGGAGTVPDEGSTSAAGSVTKVVSDTINLGAEKLGELFGMLGSAIIKPGVPRDKEDYSKAITAAAVKTNAEVAVTKTPKSSPVPRLPTPPNINKIDGGATQNPATSTDKNSVYYYLRRFGFQDLSTPEKALAR